MSHIDVEWGERDLLAMNNAFCTAMLRAGYHMPPDKLEWPQSVSVRISTKLEWSQHRFHKWKLGSMAEIAKQVAQKHNITMEDMKSERKPRNITIARQEAYYRCKQETNNSLPQIGRFFGNRDHTTILHGIRKHQERLNDRA